MAQRRPKSKSPLTTVQITQATRDRIYRLKFRKTYDEFLNDLCELYERSQAKPGAVGR